MQERHQPGVDVEAKLVRTGKNVYAIRRTPQTLIHRLHHTHAACDENLHAMSAIAVVKASRLTSSRGMSCSFSSIVRNLSLSSS